MKKIILSILLILALALGAVGFIACDPADSANTAGGKFETFTDDEQVYGFSAASAATVISAMNGGEAANVAALKSVRATSQVTDQATIDELNGYMMLVESLLSDGAFGFNNTASDREGYTDKMVVSYRDIEGNTIAYTMYYNQTVIHEETEQDGNEQETETTSRIEGVLVIDGTDYPMSGYSENSTEGNETESEHRLTVTLGQTSRLVVEQEIEQETGEAEQEYVYSLYENNVLTQRSAFEYEQERGETEIKLMQTVNNVSTVFYFDKETENGEEVIRIRVGSKEAAESYRVTIVDNGDGTTSYVYTTSDGNRFEHGRR